MTRSATWTSEAADTTWPPASRSLGWRRSGVSPSWVSVRPTGSTSRSATSSPKTLLVKLGGSRARTATSTRPNGSPALDTVWVRPVTVFLMVSVTS